jgi:class 3 adenylate cyclase/tetratricopeptide (TPR) repeat protein
VSTTSLKRDPLAATPTPDTIRDSVGEPPCDRNSHGHSYPLLSLTASSRHADGMTEIAAPPSVLAPYLPRVVRLWSEEPAAPRTRIVDGSLVSVDISGFTALAERLQAKGKEGAEELVTRISAVFGGLISAAERHGGDVLKFRGDALLLLFAGERHAERACGAASDMQWTIERIGTQETTAGTVELRMSVGVHSQPVHLFLTEQPHRELLIAGPAATRVFELEDLASAGEIVLSAETAALVDPAWVGEPKEDALLMTRLEPGASAIPPPPGVPGRELSDYVPRPLRDHLAIASGEAEHRQVTVAFLKLSETDTVLASEGPEGLLTRIDRVAQAAGRACEAYGITWLESDIDVGALKLYLTAGAPSTSGDDEEGMLRGLRDVIAACPGLTLRAGVNRGHVFTGDIGASSRRTYAVMGDTVNLAARLCGKAEAGEILTTSPVLDRARTLYETSVRMLRVKGKALEISGHVVGAALGRREPDDAVAGTLVGRDAELRALGQAFDAARTGRQQVVELVGPPGIGKSRLVGELRTLADDHGFERLQVATDPYSTAEPYGVFRSLLRRVAGIAETSSRDEAGVALAALVDERVPKLEPWLPLLAIAFDAEVPASIAALGLDPEQSRTRVHQSVETFLDELLVNPTLVVLEDAHWLDDASEFLLRHLVDRPGARPWLVCVTTRPGKDPFARAQEAHATSIVLEPLGDDVAAGLAHEIAAELALSQGDVEKLVARAAGNPLFVRELVTAARAGQRIDTLPDTVESLLTTRIDTLDPADRLLLRYASVVGPAFDLPLLGDVLQDEAPGAGDREHWGHLGEFVVERQDGLLAFRHDLVRATAYEGLSYRRRRDIHGRVGSAMEERLGTRADEEAALLSLHFFEAGDNPRAWRYAVLAGDRAEAGFANVVAAELYDRALAAAAELDDLPAEEVVRVNESLGDVCERFAAYERAFAALEAARAAGGAEAAILDARLLGKEAAVLELMGRYEDALETCARGLARLDEAGAEGAEAGSVRATIELSAGGINYRRTNTDEAVRWLERAVADAEAAGDRGTLAHAYYLLDAALTDLGRDDGLRYLELARPIYEELGDLRGLGVVLSNLGIHAYYEGRWDESAAYYAESRAAKERSGDVIGGAIQVNNEGEIFSDQGYLEQATASFGVMLRACRAAGWPFGAGAALSNLGRAAARAGRFEEAHAHFDEALALFEELAAERFVTEAQARRAECLLFEGRHEEALALAAEARESARKSPVGGLEALLERVIGLAHVQAHRPADAPPHLEESLRIARELKAEFEVALTLSAMATVGWEDAELLQAESDAILERLGVVLVPSVPLP